MADYKKPDYWQIKARDEGYPARSVYKLKEIDEKFGLLKVRSPSKAGGAVRVLDLGASPGSWSLYVLRKMPGATLVSIDLSPLSRQYDKGLFDSAGFLFIQGDITEAAVRDSIIERGPYSLIISDAAPATTGNRVVDTSRSMELAEAVLAYAESSLAANGSMVFKLFQGGDVSGLHRRMKALFKTAKNYKPASCRSESFETYCLGLGIKER
ncbi:MAG: RlmE family RNA methyltransferase [Treponema sp.]|jgi:23S rRNA (uridine2552-2'-O)-methyltransferase|nr:RlmE family RNA methyltransferase [Treponema sp.]